MSPLLELDRDFDRLIQSLCGVFSNADQAREHPIWFVQLRLWQRWVPLFAEDSVTLFLEQANMLQSDRPYRQRLLRLHREGSQILGQYYQFQNPGAVRGWGTTPDRLQSLTLDQIEILPGCQIEVKLWALSNGWGARALLVPGGRCCFEYEGQMRQVMVGFEVEAIGDRVGFRSFDKGIDPATGQALWGALMGPYEFWKEA
jgi:hypothetical protein